MKYKTDNFEITGSPVEINEFLCFAQMNDNQKGSGHSTQIRNHEEKLIEHLNKGLKEIGELQEELSRCKEHNYKLRKKIEVLEEQKAINITINANELHDTSDLAMKIAELAQKNLTKNVSEG